MNLKKEEVCDMISKGIILAGGTGSRLRPSTLSVNKQLLPIYDKPLVYYPLSTLMLAGIRKILIIVNKGSISNFKKILSDGSQIGIEIIYKEQDRPSGIPEAFKIGKKFIGNDNVALILGDNFFYGKGLTGMLNDAKQITSGCCIFLKDVKKPENYGVAVLKGGEISRIVEKPKKFVSSKAIVGIYFMDNKVIKYANQLKPSNRKETEIVDIINIYKKNKKLKYFEIGRGSIWSDVGKIEDLFNVSNYVKSIETIQGLKIACLEEIAYEKKWINKKQLLNNAKKLGKNPYSEYLKSLAK